MFSETRGHNELLLCRNDVREILFKIPSFVFIVQLILPHFAVLVCDCSILKKKSSLNHLAKLIEI
jgi:hypothetical protein